MISDLRPEQWDLHEKLQSESEWFGKGVSWNSQKFECLENSRVQKNQTTSIFSEELMVQVARRANIHVVSLWSYQKKKLVPQLAKISEKHFVLFEIMISI